MIYDQVICIEDERKRRLDGHELCQRPSFDVIGNFGINFDGGDGVSVLNTTPHNIPMSIRFSIQLLSNGREIVSLIRLSQQQGTV